MIRGRIETRGVLAGARKNRASARRTHAVMIDEHGRELALCATFRLADAQALDEAASLAPPTCHLCKSRAEKRTREILTVRSVDASTWTHAPGTPVIVMRDDGREEPTRTRSQAWNLGDGSGVVLLEGISGGFSLCRVRVDAERLRVHHERVARELNAAGELGDVHAAFANVDAAEKNAARVRRTLDALDAEDAANLGDFVRGAQGLEADERDGGDPLAVYYGEQVEP